MQTRPLLSFILLLVSSASSVIAQIPNPQQVGRSPLVLVVVPNPDTEPNYQPLPDWSGFMYTRFARIKGWQQPPGLRNVTSVYVTSTMEGEAVTVRVAVLYGADAGTVLGAYPIRENETLVIEDLKRLGIEPFKITLTRIAPVVPAAPVLRNDTKAVDVVGIQPGGMSLPSYQLTLRNVSPKNISALMISVTLDGSKAGGAFLEGEDGKPLIQAGALYIADNLLVTKPENRAGNFSPTTPMSVVIVVDSLTFEDGQYEGNPGSAQIYQGKVLGRKTFIRAFLRITDQQLRAADNDRPEALLEFKENLLKLEFEFDENDVKTAIGLLPHKSDPKFVADSTIRFLRRQVIGDIDELLALPIDKRMSLKQWLPLVRNRYAEWLARL